MTQTTDYAQLLSAQVPNLDEDLAAYALSYLRDPDGAGSSPSDVVDFLGPILETEDLAPESIQSLCTDLAELMESKAIASGKFNPSLHKSGLTTLSSEIRMSGLTSNTLTFTQLKKVDIRHGGSKVVESQVDQRKLRQAEKKLAEKRAARGVIDEREVPVWNPSVKPSIVVNQMRPSTQAMESRSKDIKLENFDIAFAGNPILQNANMTLNFGGRYGLVGKNGVRILSV
jgi:ATP-binding cassette subfamily F protein 3